MYLIMSLQKVFQRRGLTLPFLLLIFFQQLSCNVTDRPAMCVSNEERDHSK